jgi:hypothetical protein
MDKHSLSCPSLLDLHTVSCPQIRPKLFQQHGTPKTLATRLRFTQATAELSVELPRSYIHRIKWSSIKSFKWILLLGVLERNLSVNLSAEAQRNDARRGFKVLL